MEKEQALLVLVNAAHQAKLSYSDHITIEQAKAVLAKALDVDKKEEGDGEV
tara:strand:+ start:396 stop:548 length:153 start_codon:yes stop_codon:yes gene_type:complete